MSFLSRFKPSSSLTSHPNHGNKASSRPSPASSSSTLHIHLPPPITLPALSLPSPTFDVPNTPDSVTVGSGAGGSAGDGSGSWIKLNDERTTGTARGALVNASGGSGRDAERKEREDEEKRRMDGAVLNVGVVRELVDACAKVIKERGSTTLGLFRPYRLSSSQYQIRQLALLFLSYSSTIGREDPDVGPEEARRRKEKFDEEMRYANVHDVVGLLKWGLRHLQYPPPSTFSSLSPSTPLSFWSSFMEMSQTSFSTSFNKTLLPLLPPPSQQLLLTTLPLLESIAAHQEYNGLSPRRLCRLVGLFLFGVTPPTPSTLTSSATSTSLSSAKLPSALKKPKTSASSSTQQWESWKSLYEAFLHSGEILEHLLRLFLSSQVGLPKRLQEIADGEGVGGGRVVRVLVVEVERVVSGGYERSGDNSDGSEEDYGVNDQATGKVVRGRRVPLRIMEDAVGATKDEEAGVEETKDGAGELWEFVKGVWREQGVVGVLSEETIRVLKLVGLDKTPLLDTEPRRQRSLTTSGIPGSATTNGLSSLTEETASNEFLPFSFSSSTFHFSSQPLHLQHQSQATNFPNKSVGHFASSSVTNRSERPTSWGEFARTGFTGGIGGDAGGLLDEFGIKIPNEKEVMIIPKSKSFGGSAGGSLSGSGGTKGTVSSRRKSTLHPTRTGSSTSVQTLKGKGVEEDKEIRLVRVGVEDVEEEFMDLWLETLADPGGCRGWPSFVISDFDKEFWTSSTITSTPPPTHILISERILKYSDSQTTNGKRSDLKRQPSSKSQTPSIAESVSSKRKWNYRMSTLFAPNSSSNQNHNNNRPSSASLTLAPPPPPPSYSTRVVPPVPELPKDQPLNETLKQIASGGTGPVIVASGLGITTPEKEEGYDLNPPPFPQSMIGGGGGGLEGEKELGGTSLGGDKGSDGSFVEVPKEPIVTSAEEEKEHSRVRGEEEDEGEAKNSEAWTSLTLSPVASLAAVAVAADTIEVDPKKEHEVEEEEVTPTAETNGSSSFLEERESEPLSASGVMVEEPLAASGVMVEHPPAAPVEEFVDVGEEKEVEEKGEDEKLAVSSFRESKSSLETLKKDDVEDLPVVTEKAEEVTSKKAEEVTSKKAEEVTSEKAEEAKDGPDTLVSDDLESPQQPSVNEFVTPSKPRPIRTSSLALADSAPLALTTSSDSQTPTIMHPASPASVSASPATAVPASPSSPVAASPTASSPSTTPVARKFLGSKNLGEMLRRKKSSAEKMKLEAEAAEKERMEKQLREVEIRKKEEAKKPVPVPVSSVKKRVMELEEEQKAALIAASPSLAPTSPALDTTPTASGVFHEQLRTDTPPPQEEQQRFSSKLPAHLSEEAPPVEPVHVEPAHEEPAPREATPPPQPPLPLFAAPPRTPTPIFIKGTQSLPPPSPVIPARSASRPRPPAQDQPEPEERVVTPTPAGLPRSRSESIDSDLVSASEGTPERGNSPAPVLKSALLTKAPSQHSLAETTHSFATAEGQQSDDEY